MFLLSCRALLRPAAALLATVAWAAPAELGFDTTVDASAGLAGGAARGETLHALALVHATWMRPATGAAETELTGHASVLRLQGDGPTGRFLGDFLAASNIEGHPSTRLYATWLQGARDGWSVRAGALLADEEFAGTDAGATLVNSAFGWPAFISANVVNTGPAFFVPALGVRLERTLSETSAWRVGVYDGDSFDSPDGDPRPTRHGLHHRLGRGQGACVLGEVDFTLGDGTRAKLGGWWHTADFADLRFDEQGGELGYAGGPPRMHSGNRGIYVACERTLAGSTGDAGAVDVFLRGGVAPSDRSPVAWALDTGVAWTGPIPGRGADVFAVGLAHARLSSSLAATARLADPATPALDYETVLELAYTAQLGEHFTAGPHVQFIRHPGGSAALAAATLTTLRVTAAF